MMKSRLVFSRLKLPGEIIRPRKEIDIDIGGLVLLTFRTGRAKGEPIFGVIDSVKDSRGVFNGCLVLDPSYRLQEPSELGGVDIPHFVRSQDPKRYNTGLIDKFFTGSPEYLANVIRETWNGNYEVYAAMIENMRGRPY